MSFRFDPVDDEFSAASADAAPPTQAATAGTRPERLLQGQEAQILDAHLTEAFRADAAPSLFPADPATTAVPGADSGPTAKPAAKPAEAQGGAVRSVQPAPGTAPEAAEAAGVAAGDGAGNGAGDGAGNGAGNAPALTPTDPLYAEQWHFALIGDIETIWEEYSGAGVTVYVADDGVEYTHEDLAANYDASMHFTYGGTVYDPMPAGFRDGHGTSVAGLIAAEQGNDAGGTGVAWGATLTGVNFIVDTQTQPMDVMLASLEWAENFDIMSNSWGITPSYGSYQSPFDTPGNSQYDIAQVYESISATGRDGLGTVVVQASGNDALNAQGDALNGTRFTVSVAATDAAGFAASYTNYGTNILITAPAAAVTTDLTGLPGYDRGDYTDEFGGTSAATPVVSGVIALMLEANPGLGWRDVHNILAASASLTGSAYDATTLAPYEQDFWFSNGADNWNGGGMTFNLSYGYGMVDAFAAVRMAEVWHILYGPAQTSANEMHVSASSGTAMALADNATTFYSIEVTDDIAIENIQVTIDITHANAPDLEIWLVAPDGTEFMLFYNEGTGSLMASGFEWIFGVEAARGMTSAGTWQIMVIDEAAGATGTLDGVTLDFHGSEVSGAQVHHITEDFLTLAGAEADRAVLTAGSGTDILNMAAIAGAIEISLFRGGSITVDGVHWADLDTAGGEFDSFVAGDGDDTIEGNGTANEIWGMRGDDTIEGRAGQDTLYGETGNDVLDGGTENDVLYGGDGDDTLIGVSGFDVLYGGAGNDSLEGNSGLDTLYGGDGHDTLYGGPGSDELHGDGGNDLLIGLEGFDLMYGGGGNDSLEGNFGQDTLHGGAGDDTLDGGTENDELHGGGGADLLIGGPGFDLMYGDDGHDTLYGDDGHDTLYGGDGDDLLIGGTGGDALYGGDGDDMLEGRANFDLMYGGGGSDTLYGGDGNDTLYGDTGNDVLVGGPGNDRLYGGAGNDRLEGGANNDRLEGGADNDTLYGGDGQDTIEGGSGDDLMFGGPGADVFVFTDDFGQDRVMDFTAGADLVDLSGVTAITGFNDLSVNHLSQGASGAEIVVGAHLVTLEGVLAADLTEDDFLF